ncbi:sugar MFS transporter [Bacteroides nordii]|uniref:sugar MFS transporter n=1 Tax=Bacteroides nordii TaxID=291645 RepID=UPI00241DD2A9|nr:sugar MFS transporter [Bacteroides nordii]MBD9112151.1 MFS transporter [Bacteroides nordii]
MQKQRYALVKREYRVPFILVTSLFFLWGFAHAILDVLNKHFQDVLVISRAHSAWVQVMFYLGYFVMAIPAGLFINKYGYRRGVVLGLLLYGLGSLLFIPGEYWMSFNFFLFSLFVIACGLVFLETAANPYMTELGDKETAASRLNLAQSFNGLGCICGPLIGGLLLFSGEGEAAISLPYTLMGIVVLAVAMVFSKIRLPEIVHEEEGDREGKAKSLWSHKLFIFGIAALFCYEIAEISINSFFINYVVDDGWMSARDASIVLSFGGLGLFMCGRFAGSWIMQRICAEKVLLFCAVCTVITSLLIVLNVGIVSLVALFLGYAFEAIMFPTIFALSLRGLGKHTKRASSYLMMSPVGGAVGPLMMGYVADQTTMSLSFIVPLLSFIVVMLYAWKVSVVKL